MQYGSVTRWFSAAGFGVKGIYRWWGSKRLGLMFHGWTLIKEEDSVRVQTGFPACGGVNTLMGQFRGQGGLLGLARVIKVVQTP